MLKYIFMLYPLKHATAQEIAGALFSIFCRMGFLEVTLSANGSQFLSRTMRRFTYILSIAQNFSSIYNTSYNGIIDKFHHCLK